MNSTSYIYKKTKWIYIYAFLIQIVILKIISSSY